MLSRFWVWYEQHYQAHLIFSTILFLLQLFHLYWMASHIVALRLIGRSLFVFPQQFSWLYALVDYTEIPALLSVSLIYINSLREGSKSKIAKYKNVLFLVFLNIQWIHLFWITDEIVLTNLTGTAIVPINPIFAWFAILIDFLELPVMAETAIKTVRSLVPIKISRRGLE